MLVKKFFNENNETEAHPIKLSEKQLPSFILQEIRSIGKRFQLRKIVLFGSRARGDQEERSDIDLAFPAKNAGHYFDVEDAFDQIPTLLSFDLVDMNGAAYSKALDEEIKRDGIILYEEI